MNRVEFNATFSNPTVTVTLETDDVQALKSLYHRLNIGRNRLCRAKAIRGGAARGQKYADQYHITPDDVAAKGTPLGDLADKLEGVLRRLGELS